MPRKTKAAGIRTDWYHGFNEAAARCRGKHPAVRPNGGGGVPRLQ